jgi:Tol biopolymer transport system component
LPKDTIAHPVTSFRGKLVLFGTRRHGDPKTRIEMMDADGTGSKTVLTFDEGQSVSWGRIAPDGKRLAFTTARAKGKVAELWLLTPEGTRRKLADKLMVTAWSPDGTHLTAIRENADETREWENVILDVETGQEQRLPISRSSVVDDWSPDGTRLAVMVGNPDKQFRHPTKGIYPLRQIELCQADGTGCTPLTTGGMTDNLKARFSPDGKRLIYFQRRHPNGGVFHFAVVQDRSGANARDVAQFDAIYRGNREYKPHGAPCWSPDGKSVVWMIPRRKVDSSSLKTELLFLTVDDGRPTRIDLDQRGIAWVQAIDWR